MKKRIFSLAAVIICLAILASGTLAYFTTEDTARNVITSGAVDIQIEERQNTGPYPDKPIEAMPGTTVSKIVTIKNTEAEAYIRAKFDVTITDAAGSEMQLSPATLANIISVKMNGSDWLRKDGDSQWWYYKDAVATGASTEAFITEVVFDGPNMTNEYQNCTAEVIVKAQAVQTANNPIPDGGDVTDVKGWPEA